VVQSSRVCGMVGAGAAPGGSGRRLRRAVLAWVARVWPGRPGDCDTSRWGDVLKPLCPRHTAIDSARRMPEGFSK
jgi:hypothetical protein